MYKIIALIGKSGSGKSTILNLIAKMNEVDSGEVLIDGVNINKLDKDTLRNISEDALPELMRRIERVHEAERRNFFTYFKQANWSGIDRCYGALMSRAKTAKMLIDAYLAGEIDKIDSLEEERLHRPVNGFLPYKTISSHTP